MNLHGSKAPSFYKRNIQRNLPKLIISSLALIIFIPLTGMILLYLPWVQERIIDHLAHQLRSRTNIEVDLAEYRWSPFSHLRLNGLRIKSPKYRIRCESAELTYRMAMEWPYLLPKVLLLVKPMIEIERVRGEKWRIPKASIPLPTRGNGKISRWRAFPWPEIRVESGTIVAYENGRVFFSIKDVSGKLPVKVTKGEKGLVVEIELGQWQQLEKFY